MESLRIVSGWLFLLGFLSNLRYLIQLILYFIGVSEAGFGADGSHLFGSLPNIILTWLIPGIASLILKKPTKKNSIILTVVLGGCLVAIYIIIIANRIISQVSFSDTFTSVNGLIPRNGSLFCLLMAIISISQPERLVKEPLPTEEKVYKRVEGILGIINAVPFIAAGLLGLVMYVIGISHIYHSNSIIGRSIVQVSYGMTLSNFLFLGTMMLIGGVLSLSCTKKCYQKLSSAYVFFLVLVGGTVNSLLDLIKRSFYVSSNSLGVSFNTLFHSLKETSGNTLTGNLYVELLLFSGIMSLWYLTCTIISMIIALRPQKKRSVHAAENHQDRTINLTENVDVVAQMAINERPSNKKREKTFISLAVGAEIVVLLLTLILPIYSYASTAQRYASAVKFYEVGKYEKAIAAFKDLNGFKDSDTQIVKCKAGVIKQADVGHYVSFGSFEQDNNLNNGKEEIEWLVLAKEGNKVLLISRYRTMVNINANDPLINDYGKRIKETISKSATQ